MEGLIYFLVVFTPWAFGTTETWSMAVADTVAYLLGLLCLSQQLVWWLAHRANRKAADLPVARTSAGSGLRLGRWLTGAVAVLTLALLTYVLISAINGRAAYDWSSNTFTYFPCLPWLPHSYDVQSTWLAFWNYLAWAAFFWAVHDWLGQRGRETSLPTPPSDARTPPSEIRTPHSALRNYPDVGRPLPACLRRLLWVLSISGGVLALEALLQQTSDTNKLLWIKDTFYNRAAEAQFGPYPYRANGAQYLNLIWPVTLGFWWSLHRNRNTTPRRTRHHLLLPLLLMMMVGPFVSLSRGGALVTLGSIGLCAGVVLVAGLRRRSGPVKWAMLGVFVGAMAGGLAVAGPKLTDRMKEIGASYAERERMTQVGRRIAADNPVFGTGAETLQPVYQFYRSSPDEYWPGQLHNDWLETRVTFGWAGFSLILVALAATVLRWFIGGEGVRASWRFVSFLWISMAGCLVHARWDLPFQVYSIVLLFLLYAAILLRTVRTTKA
jgi:hypothetical protein